MKPLYFCCLLQLLVCRGMSQSSVPEPGIFTEEEKNLTVCSFDKEADAVILLDHASGDYNDQHNLVTTRRTRIKILKPSGVQRANIEIPYYSEGDFEYIGRIEAYVYNFDDNGTMQRHAVANSQIFRQKTNQYWSSVKFTFPDVKVGSIIEYQYTSTMKHYGGLEDWYFQRDIPTLLSNYSLVILPNYEFTYLVHKSDQLPIDIQSEKGTGRIRFEMKNIAGLRDEPFMDAPRDYIQRVEFQLSGYGSRFGGKSRYMTTWDELTRELMMNADFGRQLNKKLANTADFMNTVKALPDAFEKLKAIYAYVQKNMSWDGTAGKYSRDGVKNAWEKKKGNNAELNFILLNLLEEAGLDAYPLLVSERGHGKVNASYPFLDQFNTVMAYVLIGEKSYVLDVASPYTPPVIIPFSVVNTNAFIVNRKKGGIINLKETVKADKNLVLIQARINDKGEMSGNAAVYSYDYASITRKRAWYRNKEKFRDEYFGKYHPGMKIDSLNLEYLDKDTLLLEQKVHFVQPATTSGDYMLINLNLFSGFDKNPFVADNRFTNIDYGCLQQYTITASIQIPEHLQPESLPKDIRMILPDKSISIERAARFANNTLSIRCTIQTTRSVFTPDEYGYLKEFYKKMENILNEQLVLKAKTQP